jgi:hypothetical protein
LSGHGREQIHETKIKQESDDILITWTCTQR